MNGPHDVGGRDGFGPVRPEADEPLFHAPWERRALALTVAAGALGRWTIDEARAAREDRHPAEYYRLSYYALWLRGLERLLLRHGMLRADEIARQDPSWHVGTGAERDGLSGRDAAGSATVSTEMSAPLPAPPPDAAGMAQALARGGPADRDPGSRRPAFAEGDRVRTRNLQPRGHVRLPAYARDKPGRIAAIRGFHLFADTSALGDRETAHWLYTVEFEAQTLFGVTAGAADTVSIDAWEPYLDRL